MGLDHSVPLWFLLFFEDRVIALNYSNLAGTGMNCLPYSPDLTPCEYFLCVTLKGIVFWNNPGRPEDLEKLICDPRASISVDTLLRVIEKFILRLRHLCFVKSGHFEQIVMCLQ